jgi:hypothetical protein
VCVCKLRCCGQAAAAGCRNLFRPCALLVAHNTQGYCALLCVAAGEGHRSNIKIAVWARYR